MLVTWSNMHNITFTVRGQVKSTHPFYARESGKLLIGKCHSFHHGINTETLYGLDIC